MTPLILDSTLILARVPQPGAGDQPQHPVELDIAEGWNLLLDPVTSRMGIPA
jgi:hypothetical protein